MIDLLVLGICSRVERRRIVVVKAEMKLLDGSMTGLWEGVGRVALDAGRNSSQDSRLKTQRIGKLIMYSNTVMPAA